MFSSTDTFHSMGKTDVKSMLRFGGITVSTESLNR